MTPRYPRLVMPHSRLIDRARALRRRSTATERTVWRWLRNHSFFGFKFRRQHPIGNYIADFYCADLRLVIEVDGGMHDIPAKQAYDIDRSCELSKLGITVIRIRNDDVRRNAVAAGDAVMGAIVRLICERSGRGEREVLSELYGPSPSPLSPQAGRGDWRGWSVPLITMTSMLTTNRAAPGGAMRRAAHVRPRRTESAQGLARLRGPLHLLRSTARATRAARARGSARSREAAGRVGLSHALGGTTPALHVQPRGGRRGMWEKMPLLLQPRPDDASDDQWNRIQKH
ncbi:MAG TPA: endonuclease domain-containing protein [Thermoanaerobaculia bacterium]|nr:endonuclease domain-containing protein [Thermoanaerobaculia bacterium]